MAQKYPIQAQAIEGLLKDSGITAPELAKSAGFTEGTIYKYRKGYQKASDQAMQALRNAANLCAERRELTPKPSSSSDKKESLSNGQLVRVSAATRRVPVVSWASAGGANDYTDMCNQIEEYIDTECRDPNAFALIIEGRSMEPRFHAGDRVVFSPNSEPRNGDFVVARLREDHGVLFKLFHHRGPEGQTVLLESLNPDYKSKEYDLQAFRFIYPAIEFSARLRR